jgi:hypothetical protein
VRLGAFLCGILGIVLCVTIVAPPAAGSFATPFARDAIEYLRTRGLLPLWPGITRPTIPWSFEAALDVGQAMQRPASLSVADQAVLRLLDPAFGSTGTSRDLVRHSNEVSLVAPFGDAPEICTGVRRLGFFYGDGRLGCQQRHCSGCG